VGVVVVVVIGHFGSQPPLELPTADICVISKHPKL